MFGRKKRKQRKAEEEAARERDARAVAVVEAAEPEVTEPENAEPENAETGQTFEARPVVALLTDGERLGFEPELHIPSDSDS